MDSDPRGLLDHYLRGRRLSNESLGSKLGRDPSWVSRIRNKKAYLRVDDLLEILKVAEISAREYFRDLLDGLEDRDTLEALLEHQDLRILLLAIRGEHSCSSELLDSVAKLPLPSPGPEELFEVPFEAAEIDSLREIHSGRALQEAESWIRSLLAACSKRSKPLTSDAARLAVGLGVWGSALRVRGEVHRASEVLELAVRIHGEAQESPSYADLLERAAFVCQALGYPKVGIALVKQALPAFLLTGNHTRLPRSFLALGALHYHRGHLSNATMYFRQVLSNQHADPVRKVAAAMGAALVFEQQGRLAEADAMLDELEDLRGQLPPAWDLSLRGLQARLLARQGLLSESATLFRACLKDHRNPGRPEILLMFFDYASVLLHLGRSGQLAEESRDLGHLPDRLAETPAAHGIAAAFFETVRAGELSKAIEVDRVASRFREALQGTHLSSWPHPTGSGFG